MQPTTKLKKQEEGNERNATSHGLLVPKQPVKFRHDLNMVEQPHRSVISRLGNDLPSLMLHQRLRRNAAIIINAARRSTMSYTLHQAATATGLHKTSILRAIKSGRISGAKDDNGQWHVEPVELHRVFPPVAERNESTDAEQRDAALDLAEAHQRARQAAHALSELQATLDDMRRDRDCWRDQAQASMRQLTDQREHERRPWWRRMAG